MHAVSHMTARTKIHYPIRPHLQQRLGQLMITSIIQTATTSHPLQRQAHAQNRHLTAQLTIHTLLARCHPSRTTIPLALAQTLTLRGPAGQTRMCRCAVIAEDTPCEEAPITRCQSASGAKVSCI